MGDLRQARLRRGRDRRHAAGRPASCSPPRCSGCSSLRRAGAPARRCAAATSASRSRSAPIGYGAQAGGYFAALERLDASLLSLLVYTFPVIVTVAAIALGRERGEPAHGGGAGARLGRARARARRRRRGRARPGRHRARRSGRRSSTARTSSSREGVAGRVGPLALGALVCTGAAATLTLGAARRRRPATRRPSARRASAGSAASPSSRRSRAIALFFAGPAARRPDGGVDPLDARAGGDRRARVRRLRRVARAARSSPAARSCCAAVLAVRRRPDSTGGSHEPLEGKVALVAGATRGAGRGIAVALGEAGATVYCTGRSTRERRSEYDRPETIEETAELVDRRRRRRDRRRGRPPRARRRCARSWSGSTPSRAGSTCSSTTSGAASGCSSGTRRCGSTTSTTGCGCCGWRSTRTSITSHFALPLLIRRPGGLVVEMTDGTREYNARELPQLGLLRPRQERASSGSRSPRARSSRRTAARPSRSRPAGCARR